MQRIVNELVTEGIVILENNPNNTPPQAQAVALPVVLAGKLEAVEDLDYYKFESKEGETLTFEMVCARLQDKIHDLQKHAKPMLSLFDDQGRELAANDTFFFADPLLSYTIPKAGSYFLQVRESTYDGDARWVADRVRAGISIAAGANSCRNSSRWWA